MPQDHNNRFHAMAQKAVHDREQSVNALSILDPGTAVVLLGYYRRISQDRDLQPFELARRDMCERLLNEVARKRMTQIAWPMDCADSSDNG